MPLHLLGKKSWNVYNKANIETVRRDEAIARAKEEAEEERAQALDAERRMKILRGERPASIPTLPDNSTIVAENFYKDKPERNYREKKIRKRAGESSADFEIRVASQKVKEIAAERYKPSLTISMIPKNDFDFQKLKNTEAEREATEKRKEYEDQYTMRFSNAAGYKQNPGELPWYSRNELEIKRDVDEVCNKNVWGNIDPQRSQRENDRINSNDPLVMMRAGASRARKVEEERKRWRERERIRRHSEKEKKRSLQKERKHAKKYMERRENTSPDIRNELKKKRKGEYRRD